LEAIFEGIFLLVALWIGLNLMGFISVHTLDICIKAGGALEADVSQQCTCKIKGTFVLNGYFEPFKQSQ